MGTWPNVTTTKPYAIDVAGLVDSRRADGPEMSPTRRCSRRGGRRGRGRRVSAMRRWNRSRNTSSRSPRERRSRRWPHPTRSRHVGLRLDARTARADPLLRVRQISSALGPTRSQIASPRLAFADEPRKIHHPTGEREGDRPRVASSRTPGTAGGTRTPPRAGAASGRLPQLPSPARHNR